MPVVDCQVHLHTRTYFEAHVERVEPPWAERVGADYVFRTAGGGRRRISSAHYEIDAHLERCAVQGIDVVVSSMGRFNVHHLPASRARELAMRLNEEQAELERSHPGRYYGLALLPMQDTRTAIETLDHAVRALGLRGVCVCSNVNGESIAAPGREPIYRRIAELGVPLFLHPTTIGAAIDPGIAALELLVSGVLERNPTLRVVDPRLGAVPPDLPPDQLRRLYADTARLGDGQLRTAAETLGPERLLYASHYPHREPGAGLRDVRARFSGEARDRVLGANAAALLGLGAGSGFAAGRVQTSRASLRRRP